VAACKLADRQRDEDLEKALANGQLFPSMWEGLGLVTIIIVFGGLIYHLPI
jgi:hypothetical protein